MNLVSGILFTGLILRANLQHDGFKSQKARLSFLMTITIGLVTCIGFYGDNYVIEFCYSLFPLMIIFENSFVDIIHYNVIINSVYVPLKTLHVFINVMFNDGWYADTSYWPLIIALVTPQLIKMVYYAFHRRKRPGFYKKLSGREIEAYNRRQAILKKREENERKMRDRGMVTLEGEDLIAELKKGEDENPNCAICLDGCIDGEDENDSGVVKTRCGHWFHKDCLEDWKARKDHCPLCR